jgi:regulator of sigma E protease
MATLQFILSLSLLILLHEGGHFLAARLTRTRVEKFYLFFDFLFPLPTVWNFAIFKKKIGDTEYGLGWFPLGGYVKIAGMMDESMDEDSLKLPPKPDEYRSKNNWQKMLIMLGGIIVNVLVGWLIYSQLLFWEGEAYLPAEGARYGIECDSIALLAGFQNGDVILSHDGGKKFQSFNSIPRELILDNIKTVEVTRAGEPHTVNISSEFVAKAVNSHAKGFFDHRIPCLVGSFSKETVVKGKLQKGDRIIGINDSSIHLFTDARPVLQTLKGKEAKITYIRNSDTLHTAVAVPATGLLGFAPPTDLKAYKGFLDYQEINYSFIGSFGAGAKKALQQMGDYLKQFKLIFSPSVKGYKQVGGFMTMASIFPTEWDWVKFWSLTAFLSLILAVANLMPIPMLDGGYVLMLIIEMIIRRPIPERIMENIQKVGLVIVLFLMVFSNGNDIYRWAMTKFAHG